MYTQWDTLKSYPFDEEKLMTIMMMMSTFTAHDSINLNPQ